VRETKLDRWKIAVNASLLRITFLLIAEENRKLLVHAATRAQKAADFILTSFRNLTHQLKGLPPGPEGSMMKLCATELGLKIAMFAMELVGWYSQFEHGAPFAMDQGT
jgi:hypothetical protein